MKKEKEVTLGGLTDEQQAILEMFLEKEDFQTETTVDDTPVITPRPEDRYKPFPLTDIQLAYVIGRSNSALSMSNVSSHGYFEFAVDNLDAARYEAAWRKEIARHDMMRMVILPNGTQQVLEEKDLPEFRVRVNDFTALDGKAAEQAIQGIRDRLQQNIKPLDTWPLFDIEVTHLAGHHDIIHLSLEGLFGDDKSMQTMMGEVQAFYNNPGVELPPLHLLFRDYVLSLENRRNMASYKAAAEYWKKRIPTLPGGPVMPTIPDNEVVARPVVKPMERVVDHRHWTALQDRCTTYGISPTSILISAFAEVVRRWNMEDNFCLNLTLFNRLPLHEEIDDIIGDFTDTLLLECRADDGATFLDRTLKLRDRLWADLDNHQFGGMDVLREMNRYRSEKENVYMPVVFTSTFLMGSKYGATLSTLNLGGNPMYKRFNASQTPQLLIDHQVYEDHGELRIHWDVRSEYFRPGFLESMYDAFMDLLLRLSEDDATWHERLVTALPERERLQREAYNRTEAPVSDALMHRLFLDRAMYTPDATAVIAADRTLTYGELRDEAAAVCLQLRDRVAPDELVAVIMPKGWAQVAAVIGVQWAGAAYLPIDPAMPAGRVATIMANAHASFVLTCTGVAPVWPDGATAIAVDTLAPEDGESLSLRGDVQTPDSLAYVIYTSGSTGTPKGVMIEHRAAVNTILDVNERLKVGPSDRCLGISNLGFDLSVWDMFGLLAAGGAVVLPDPAHIREPAHWLQLLERHHVTLWNSVPPFMRMLADYTAEFAPNTKARLRAVLLSGDWLPLALPGEIRRLFGARVYSLGGATEAAIWSIMYPVEEVAPSWSSIPYGMPMKNQQFHVLDSRLEACPCHVRGALYIGGVGLARGYFADEKKTAAAFVTHPVTGERLYRTGDLGYFSPEGYIVIQGREDNQVKINGFRVELGEVEHAVRSLSGIAEAVVLPVHEGTAIHLAAYVVPAGDEAGRTYVARDGDGRLVADGGAMADALGRLLPAYMVPAYYIALDRLPVNRSGKIDRKALPAISGEDCVLAAYEEPATDVERRLAAIWGEILGERKIGRNDNFFEVGGDSLLATRLIGRVHQAFGVELSVLSVYTMPVLRNMARSLEQAGSGLPGAEGSGLAGGGADGLLLPLSTAAGGEPLFCIPGAEGSPATFLPLAGRLSCPVTTFLYPGMKGDEAPLASIEAIAGRFADEIGRVQPEGTVHLLGFCIGGFVAHALARKLAAQHRKVRCLLVDAQLLPRRFIEDELLALCLYLVMNGLPPQCIEGLDGREELAALLAMAPAPERKVDPFLSLEKLAAMDRDGRIVTVHAQCTGRGWLGDMSLVRMRAGFGVFVANMRAGYAYAPDPVPGEAPVPFLQATENPTDSRDDPMAAWKARPGMVAVTGVAANHMTIMRGQALDRVVQAVEALAGDGN